ncbi:unnamed protein product [Pichia kudriavzevii]
MTELPDSKRHKVNETNILDNKCAYFKPKNGKRCGLQVRKGQIFCFAHIDVANGTTVKDVSTGVSTKEAEITRTDKNGKIIRRVKCTIDPTHTVWEDRLTKHVKNCNVVKKKKEIADMERNVDWFSIDYNVKEASIAEATKTDEKEWKTCMHKWIAKHDLIFTDELPLENIQFKQGLEERFAELSNQKHIIQQSSLIGQLINNGLISENENPGIVIEFGCGRAEFTRYFNRAIEEINKNKPHCGEYLLIDRENPRLKFDKKIAADSEAKGNQNVKVERLKVDIKDLKLIEALRGFQMQKDSSIVGKEYLGISKHLCGVATDLTLRCLINTTRDISLSKDDLHLKGCLVAMCCRHCCKYEWLLTESKDFLREQFEIDETNFIYLRKMFAWATNGVPPGKSKDEVGDHFSGLSIGEREVIGLKMRRILDESRKYAMVKKGFEVKIVRYVERNVSLENNCIIVKNAI